jgi:hypothetical protein
VLATKSAEDSGLLFSLVITCILLLECHNSIHRRLITPFSARTLRRGRFNSGCRSSR